MWKTTWFFGIRFSTWVDNRLPFFKKSRLGLYVLHPKINFVGTLHSPCRRLTNHNCSIFPSPLFFFFLNLVIFRTVLSLWKEKGKKKKDVQETRKHWKVAWVTHSWRSWLKPYLVNPVKDLLLPKTQMTHIYIRTP